MQNCDCNLLHFHAKLCVFLMLWKGQSPTRESNQRTQPDRSVLRDQGQKWCWLKLSMEMAKNIYGMWPSAAADLEVYFLSGISHFAVLF